jgi:hypothetical protein
MSPLDIFVFVAAVVMLIYAIFNLVAYYGLNGKVKNMDTDKYNATCGVKHGMVTAGMGFSWVMLVVALALIVFYGKDVFMSGKSMYNKFATSRAPKVGPTSMEMSNM